MTALPASPAAASTLVIPCAAQRAALAKRCAADAGRTIAPPSLRPVSASHHALPRRGGIEPCVLRCARDDQRWGVCNKVLRVLRSDDEQSSGERRVDLTYNEEQRLLAEAADRFVKERYGFEARRAIVQSEE